LFSLTPPIFGFILAAKDLKKFGENNIFNQKQSSLINHGLANFILLSLFPLVKFGSFRHFRKTYYELMSYGLNKIDCRGVRYSYKCYAKAFNISPYIFYFLYAIEKCRLKYLKN
jgi:hypothetical protein